MASRKSPLQKLFIDRQPVLTDMPIRMIARYGHGKMLVPTPRQVDEIIREIPAGSVRTVSELREELGQRSGSATACPLCTGIFWRLSAEAAPDHPDGPAPYWRVVKDGGGLNEKLPGGLEDHARRLEEEGHTIRRNGKGAPAVKPMEGQSSIAASKIPSKT